MKKIAKLEKLSEKSFKSWKMNFLKNLVFQNSFFIFLELTK